MFFVSSHPIPALEGAYAFEGSWVRAARLGLTEATYGFTWHAYENKLEYLRAIDCEPTVPAHTISGP